MAGQGKATISAKYNYLERLASPHTLEPMKTSGEVSGKQITYQ
jgi:hypothetical protein